MVEGLFSIRKQVRDTRQQRGWTKSIFQCPLFEAGTTNLVFGRLVVFLAGGPFFVAFLDEDEFAVLPLVDLDGQVTVGDGITVLIGSGEHLSPEGIATPLGHVLILGHRNLAHQCQNNQYLFHLFIFHVEFKLVFTDEHQLAILPLI